VFPTLEADIRKVDEMGPMDKGVEFWLKSVGADEWTRDLSKLSGGQATVLGLCFLFSCSAAVDQDSNFVFLFDEIDAALGLFCCGVMVN
jgi:chromosome segregation ATPase